MKPASISILLSVFLAVGFSSAAAAQIEHVGAIDDPTNETKTCAAGDYVCYCYDTSSVEGGCPAGITGDGNDCAAGVYATRSGAGTGVVCQPPEGGQIVDLQSETQAKTDPVGAIDDPTNETRTCAAGD